MRYILEHINLCNLALVVLNEFPKEEKHPFLQCPETFLTVKLNSILFNIFTTSTNFENQINGM